MRRNYNTEQFQGFVRNLQESFWGDFQGRTRRTLEELLRADSEQQMEEYLGLKWYERAGEDEERVDSRNGYYERDYVTRLGVIRFRVRRTRKRSFLPRGLSTLERRAPEVAELIRQAFLRAKGESQAGWEGFLDNLLERGLRGQHLQLVITDGCAGLAAALQTVYPRARHQRCWVHKMRNICEAVRRRDHDRVKRDAQRIYQAASLVEA